MGKICSKCGTTGSFDEFPLDKSRKDGYYPQCKPCARESKRTSREKNPVTPEQRRGYLATYKARHPERVKESARRTDLKRKFNISVEEYEERLHEQQGVCAICSLPPNTKMLAVDHDHETNAVRGLLCSKCNTALGLLDDSIERLQKAQEYLAVLPLAQSASPLIA